ncbi:MAG TPA: HAMP domain-containing sensor histidine kinase [Gemmatimonadaceae bacterium]|nr:HAMP domain-containing sensor histidine kinase [Gemmatimonadaceae bacterium]
MDSSNSTSTLRLRWPLLVLLASIALTAFAAFDAQRTVRAQNSVVTRATGEFASFAAWSYGQHLQEKLSAAAREVLGAVNHGDNLHTASGVPPARGLVHYLPFDTRCDCHRPRQGPVPVDFIAFRLGSNAVDIAVNTYRDPANGWLSDDMADDMMNMHVQRSALPVAEQRWIADTLSKQVRTAPLADRGFALIAVGEGKTTRVLSYTVMPTTYGDTMIYAARYNPDELRGILRSVLDSPGLLPSTFTKGRRNRDVVAVAVTDANGNRIFDSAPGATSPMSSHLSLPLQYGGLQLFMRVNPQLAGTLVIGGLPRSRLPFLLGLLALAAAMSFVAVAQIRRETELARLRGDFVSSVSHELRTPLAQIRLYLETMRLGRASTPEQREWSLGHIEREATRLSHLVENVLRFSRMGRADVPPTSLVDVTDELGRIVDEFQPLASGSRATIEAELVDAPKMLLRPEALRHLLINLLDNAVKYGPSGQTVRVGMALKNGQLLISVSDEGPGIPKEDRELIWRPFWRGRNAGGAGGSGIGLSVVREIARQHGGDAWVEDSPRGGACFVVAIPIKAAGQSADRQLIAEAPDDVPATIAG